MIQAGLQYCGFVVQRCFHALAWLCVLVRLRELVRLRTHASLRIIASSGISDLFMVPTTSRILVRSFVFSCVVGVIFAGWVPDGQAQMRAQQWVDFDGRDGQAGEVGDVPVNVPMGMEYDVAMNLPVRSVGRVPVDEVVGGAFDEPFETESEKDERRDERTSLLKSLVLPGWGHFGLDASASTRGKIHIGTDLALLAGFVGADLRVGTLTDEYLALGELRAGVLMANRDRAFVLAMGNFNSLEEYNDFQLRSRNWNRLIEDTPENRWQWEYDEDRRRFKDIRERADLMENQLPALLGFMVINRVISGISAFNRTRAWNSEREGFAAKRGERERRVEGYGSGVDNERGVGNGNWVGNRNGDENGNKNGNGGEVFQENGVPPQVTLMPVLVNGRNTGFTAHLRFSF